MSNNQINQINQNNQKVSSLKNIILRSLDTNDINTSNLPTLLFQPNNLQLLVKSVLQKEKKFMLDVIEGFMYDPVFEFDSYFFLNISVPYNKITNRYYVRIEFARKELFKLMVNNDGDERYDKLEEPYIIILSLATNIWGTDKKYGQELLYVNSDNTYKTCPTNTAIKEFSDYKDVEPKQFEEYLKNNSYMIYRNCFNVENAAKMVYDDILDKVSLINGKFLIQETSYTSED